jgi:dihydrofolate synthase / folylpolyglutamate synthase
MTDFEKYTEAEHQLNEGLIRMDVSAQRPEGYVKTPSSRMHAMRQFLDTCDNPQAGIPAIHVTGTSGKGSVCAAISGILRHAGLKVGMHISPYLQSATEKIWIDGQYVSGRHFAELVEWVMPQALPFLSPDTPASIHGMASVAIALKAFQRAKVDVMVFEAGCGGRFDLTSFIDTKVAVITNVGLDHVVSLGPGIRDIAWHKAGIARRGAPLITGAIRNPAFDVIAAEARKLNVPLLTVAPTGDPVTHNRALAKRAAHSFADILGKGLRAEDLDPGLTSVQLPGRFERIPTDVATVFLDGAHNGDKLGAAVNHALVSHETGKKIAVIGLLGTKASEATVAAVRGRFDHIIATEPIVYGKSACPARETAQLFDSEKTPPIVCSNYHDAVSNALQMAKGGTVLICGSFYLCGAVRDRWYPKREVVLQQTSWPTVE